MERGLVILSHGTEPRPQEAVFLEDSEGYAPSEQKSCHPERSEGSAVC